MAKSPPLPPGPEECQALLNLLASAPGPQTTAELIKRLTPPHRWKAPQVDVVLVERVTTGEVCRFAPTTAKGKPRYWTRDLTAWLKGPVRQVLEAAHEPLAAATVARQLAVGARIGEADLQPVLETLRLEGVVHLHPPTTAKGKPRFSTRTVGELLRPAILQWLTTRGGQPLAKIVTGLKGSDPELVRQAVGQLQQERRVFLHPAVGKKGQPLFKTSPIAPLEFLGEVRSALVKVVPTLQSAGVTPEELRRALVQVAAEAGIVWGASVSGIRGTIGSGIVGGEVPVPAPPATEPAATPSTLIDLVTLMKQMDPGAELGTLIGAADLRRRAGLSKEEFDRQSLALARAGHLSLHQHDFPGSLSPERLAELITDGAGRYYVGLALRRGDT